MAALTPPPSTKRKSRTDSESTLIIPKFIPTMQPTLVDDPPPVVNGCMRSNTTAIEPNWPSATAR